MKRLFTAALLAGALALPADAALRPPAKAPDFSLTASLAGQEFQFSLADALKKGPAVVYFYPAAFTQGCNIEANAFATNIAKFEAAGATIIGVSQDSIERLNAFSADPAYCAGKFPVASDAGGAVAKSYDLTAREGRPGMKDSRGQELAAGTMFTERTTFVINQQGEIVATLSSNEDKVTPYEHAEKSLAVVQELAKKK
jgi:peroxiredoxin